MTPEDMQRQALLDAESEKRPLTPEESAAHNAFVFGPNIATWYDLARANLNRLDESDRKLLEMEIPHRNSLAALLNGYVLPMDSMLRTFPSTTVLLSRMGGAAPERVFQRLDANCRAVSASVENFTRCAAGVYVGTTGSRKPRACEVRFTEDGQVSFRVGEYQYPPFRIDYRAAGSDYRSERGLRQLTLNATSGWLVKSLWDDEEDDLGGPDTPAGNANAQTGAPGAQGGAGSAGRYGADAGARDEKPESWLDHAYQRQWANISASSGAYNSLFIEIGNTEPSFGPVMQQVCNIAAPR